MNKRTVLSMTKSMKSFTIKPLYTKRKLSTFSGKIQNKAVHEDAAKGSSNSEFPTKAKPDYAKRLTVRE